MNRYAIAAAVLCLGLAGCFSDPAEKLVGKWEVDVDAISELKEFKQMDGDQREFMLAMLRTGKIEFTFTKDTVSYSMSMMGQTKTASATYEVKSADGDLLVLETVDQKGTRETVEAEFKGDLLIIEVDGNKLALRRTH